MCHNVISYGRGFQSMKDIEIRVAVIAFFAAILGALISGGVSWLISNSCLAKIHL